MNRGVLVVILITGILNLARGQKVGFDKRQGEESARKVATQMRVDSTSQTALYIRQVGQNLVGNLDSPLFNYKFYLVDMFEPNAFALPGGYIYITTGLLQLLNKEDELAGILGHEIIHSQNRHSFKAIKKNILPTLLKAPGNVVKMVNEDFGNLINAPLELTNSLRSARYNRKQENEADMHGIELAAKGGYDPLALASALEILVADVKYLTGEEEKFSYFNDHPYTPDRVDNIRNTSGGLAVGKRAPIAGSTSDFIGKMEDIYVGEHPGRGVIYKNHFLHAALNLDVTFPAGWITTNRSTYIASREPGNEAQVYMIVLPGIDPHIIADHFIAKFREEYRVESYRAEGFEVFGHSAYLFGVDEQSKGRINNSTIIWVNMGNYTYQIVGSGSKGFEKQFEAVAKSMKTLTVQSSSLISGIRLKKAIAREGETLQTLSERTGNAIKLDYLGLINQIEEGNRLQDGRVVKIGIRQRYYPGM